MMNEYTNNMSNTSLVFYKIVHGLRIKKIIFETETIVSKLFCSVRYVVYLWEGSMEKEPFSLGLFLKHFFAFYENICWYIKFDKSETTCSNFDLGT